MIFPFRVVGAVVRGHKTQARGLIAPYQGKIISKNASARKFSLFVYSPFSSLAMILVKISALKSFL